MNDLTKAIVSTLLCALLGMAVAENSIAPQPGSAEHDSFEDARIHTVPLA